MGFTYLTSALLLPDDRISDSGLMPDLVMIVHRRISMKS